MSVIIPHKDDLAGLSNTLSALTRLAVASPPFEVIVADNRSTCGSGAVADMMSKFDLPRLRLVDASEAGAGPARNVGASMAEAPLLAFLDCDCLPQPDWIMQGIGALAKADIAGGPVQVAVDDPDVPLTPAMAFDLLYGFNSRLSFHRDRMLLTGNLFVPRDVFAAVGPFRKLISEDKDWCQRARSGSFRLTLVEDLKVVHRPLESSAALRSRWRRVTDETFALMREEGKTGWSWLYYAARVALSPTVHWIRVFSDPRMRRSRLITKLRTCALLFEIRWMRAMRAIELWV